MEDEQPTNGEQKGTSDSENEMPFSSDLEEDPSSRDLKKRVLRDVTMGLVAMGCFAMFMTWSEPLVAIFGVVTIVVFAWICETKFTKTIIWITKGKTVLITGCDSGFGNMLSIHLDNLGVIVFAGCLDSSGEGARRLRETGSSRLHVLQMDITNDKQVKECLSYVERITEGEGLDGLVNNAGLNFMGDIELTTMDQFVKVANVNQFGMVRVTKAFLPLIRKTKGRIVNVTSVKGLIADPFNAAYTMTKFATEAFSDILRLEVKRFGVSVSIIEPGNFGGATGCLDMNRLEKDFDLMHDNMSEELRSIYPRSYIDLHLESVKACIPTAGKNIMDVIRAISDALFSQSPRSRYLVPGSNKLYEIYRWRILFQRFLPTRVMDWMLLRDIEAFTTHQTKFLFIHAMGDFSYQAENIR